MKYFYCCLIVLLFAFNADAKHNESRFFGADNHHINYIGRVDFSNPAKPRFWSPGVYVQAKFQGRSLELYLNDEQPDRNNYNYIEVAIDNNEPVRIRLTAKENHLTVATDLPDGDHIVIICKDTESGMGYIDFVGMKCEKLLSLKKPKRKMEFIGDSITCGAGTDESEIKCNKGLWFDEHNAYMSYGATVARELNAQYYLTSVSGIGMIHSCCNMAITMPQVFDKVILRNDSIRWDFSRYTPDVVTICLGQNDEIQDSAAFCSAYLKFVNRIRTYYPKADIVCLSSPMANAELTGMLKHLIPSVVKAANKAGDKRVTYFFFSRSYNSGCGGHPNMAEHQLIAAQLAAYLKELESW
ncbi:MAG: SGNH/GDSL hydrolase family protein [Mucilaginibacter sp.]